MRSAPLVGDESCDAAFGLQASLSRTPTAGLCRLAHETTRAQVAERIAAVDRHELRNLPAAHRHYHRAAVADVLDISAELVVQLPHADFTLDICAM